MDMHHNIVMSLSWKRLMGSTSAYYVEKSQRLLSPVKGQRRAVYGTLIYN
jgi:hypothetical protein